MPCMYVVDSNGDNGHRLTANENAEGFPAWSPDSRQIIFSTETAGDGSSSQLFIANADRNNIRQLTRQGKRNAFPRFTPDGNQLLFSSDRDGPLLDLYIMDVDGSHVRRLTSGGINSYPI